MGHIAQERGRAQFLPRQEVIMVPQAFPCSLVNGTGFIVLSCGTQQPLLPSLAADTGALRNGPYGSTVPLPDRSGRDHARVHVATSSPDSFS